MLNHLRVSNLGVLQDAAIDPAPGLTVITGETGAGKTLLLGGLRLLLGGKADPAAVGPFADQAQADGLFIAGDEEVGVTRIVPADGRSRAHLDGSIVSTGTLEERAGSLVEIVGQHDQLSLRQPSRVLSLIDSALDPEGVEALERFRAGWSHLVDLRRRQADLGGNEMALRQELDLVRFQVAEIEAASLQPEEDAVLENEASRHESMFEIMEILADSSRLGEGMQEDAGELVSRLRKLARIDNEQAPMLEQSEGIAVMLAELLSDMRRVSETIRVDPERAAEVERRLNLIGDLKRKYGSSLEDVIAFGDNARKRQSELEELLSTAERIDSDLRDALSEVSASGAALTEARRQAAAQIAGDSETHLADLGLKRARLSVEITPLDEPGPRGVDQVQILFSSDRHLQPGPISSVASGGELSRLVLAVRLATRSPGVETLVFDEVDAGVGGTTALAMGRKLAALANSGQVLCVTHLPQVAAFADTHYVVTRSGKKAEIRRVTGSDRVEEISRMLAGLPDSQASQDAAAELLATASST